jgi:glycosyltransferase involved in cell wall biosynthesis/ribosomal protein S18 acetylase RimI-like enzyme
MTSLGIVVPVKNQILYIKNNLDSIFNNARNNIEVIVVDGGSSDGTLELCIEYAKRHSNLTVLTGLDSGQSDAIRIGFSKLTTDWLTWLNGDDFYLPWTLSSFFKVAAENPTLRLIYGNAHFCSKDGVWLRNYPTIDIGEDNLANLLFNKLYVAQPSVFYQRELYEKSGGIDTNLNFVFDYDLWVKYSKIIRETEAHYIRLDISGNREYPETKTQMHYAKLLDELIQVQKIHFNRISPYVVQAKSDYKFSTTFERNLSHTYLIRLIFYKLHGFFLNLPNIKFSLKLIFTSPLALSGPIVNDRVSLFEILSKKLKSKTGQRMVFRESRNLPFMPDEPTFIGLENIDSNEILKCLEEIRAEDTALHFEPHDFTIEAVEKIKSNSLDFFAFIQSNNKFVGYILLRGLQEGYEDYSLGIFVFKDYQGTGIAKKAMSYLEQISLDRGVKNLRLSVHPENFRAKNFYSKLGFVAYGLNDEMKEVWIKSLVLLPASNMSD